MGKSGLNAAPSFKTPTIKMKFLVWFLVVALLPLCAMSTITYRIFEKSLIQEIKDKLNAVADNRARQIKNYIVERVKDAVTLARTPTIIDAVQEYGSAFLQKGEVSWRHSPGYKRVDGKHRPFLTLYRETFGFSDLFLFSLRGDAIFSVMQGEDLGANYSTGIYKETELAHVYDRAKTILETEVSNFEFYFATNKPAAFLAAPVMAERKIVGVLVVQLSNEEVYKLAEDYTGLGETGEMIIASKKDGKAIYLTPLRHDPYAAFRRRVSIGAGEDIPVQKAVQGAKGIGMYIDYRGKDVLVVWRYLPDLRWGMALKMDMEEVSGSVADLRNSMLAVGAFTIVAVILMAIFISKTISDPIMKLNRASKLIAAGDLSIIAPVSSEDEIGQLASSFNEMVLKLSGRTVDLERSNKELEQFAYVASHDLQEPLRMVTSYTQLFAERYEGQLDEKAKKYILYTVDGAQRMQRLITDLLTYSRIRTRANPPEPVDANEVFRMTLLNLQVAIKESGATVTCGDLPIVLADPTQLSQVFQNLIGNSIKFRQQETPRIRVTAQDIGDRWLFSIIDNGIGIDAKYGERIFVIFQRLHTREEYPGTGIGLALCKRIIQDHGGRIWFESEPGKGSTFYFTMPKKKEVIHA